MGVPVVGTEARQKEGMDELLKYIYEVASGEYICKPYRISDDSKVLSKAVIKLQKEIEEAFPGLPNSRWVALRLLEGDQTIIEAVKSGELKNLLTTEISSKDLVNV